MSSDLTYLHERLQMREYEHNGFNYHEIQGHSWSELKDIQSTYKRHGYRTWLNFGDICAGNYILTIELKNLEVA